MQQGIVARPAHRAASAAASWGLGRLVALYRLPVGPQAAQGTGTRAQPASVSTRQAGGHTPLLTPSDQHTCRVCGLVAPLLVPAAAAAAAAAAAERRRRPPGQLPPQVETAVGDSVARAAQPETAAQLLDVLALQQGCTRRHECSRGCFVRSCRVCPGRPPAAQDHLPCCRGSREMERSALRSRAPTRLARCSSGRFARGARLRSAQLSTRVLRPPASLLSLVASFLPGRALQRAPKGQTGKWCSKAAVTVGGRYRHRRVLALAREKRQRAGNEMACGEWAVGKRRGLRPPPSGPATLAGRSGGGGAAYNPRGGMGAGVCRHSLRSGCGAKRQGGWSGGRAGKHGGPSTAAPPLAADVQAQQGGRSSLEPASARSQRPPGRRRPARARARSLPRRRPCP